MASPPNRQGLFVVGRFGSSRACCDGLKTRVGVVLFSERESAGPTGAQAAPRLALRA